MTITKLTIVALGLFAVAALVLLFMRSELVVSGIGSQTVSSNRDPYGSVRSLEAAEKVNRDLLITDNSHLSSLGKDLQASEEWKAEPSEFFPAPSPQFGLPVEIAKGVEAPWAWIGKLAPDKRKTVEKVFDDAAAAVSGILPPINETGGPEFETVMSQLEQDVASRLKSILSPQEFEAYLWSLPDDALERLGYEKSGN